MQELVRSGQATEGVGNMLHEAEVNRRLLWSKLPTIEVNGLGALRIARKNEKYMNETCQSLRKEMFQLKTQLKDGIARALQAETSIGSQDAGLERATADIEALRKKQGGMSINDNPTEASASTPRVGDGNPNPFPPLA